MKKTNFYAVANGRETGVFHSWSACQSHVSHYPNAVFKSFSTAVEASSFVAEYSSKRKNKGGLGKKPKSIAGKNEQIGLRESHLEVGHSEKLLVYTDGSCHGNGKIGSKAGIGVYFAPNDPRNISEPLPRTFHKATNNRAEMSAMIQALKTVRNTESVIYTDSQYLVNGITRWMTGWKSNGWKKKDGRSILNVDLWEELYGLYTNSKCDVEHCKAHSGIVGNEMADKFANMGAERY
jgi:ribonuclease HI